jgi:hypothetical protein
MCGLGAAANAAASVCVHMCVAPVHLVDYVGICVWCM